MKRDKEDAEDEKRYLELTLKLRAGKRLTPDEMMFVSMYYNTKGFRKKAGNLGRVDEVLKERRKKHEDEGTL